MAGYVLSSDAFLGLEHRCLFYPSAGSDRILPLSAFRPWIDHFWFVDRAYDLDSAPSDPDSVLEDFTHDEVTGTTIRTGTPFRVLIRHERYRRSDGSKFTIHSCRGRGYDTLRAVFSAEKPKISVFFHRGDSPGEGGSNFHWLGRRMLPHVLSYLEPGGIIVSDGSLALRQFRGAEPDESQELPSAGRSFEVASHSFSCVGYLGQRNGPTFAWKTSRTVAV